MTPVHREEFRLFRKRCIWLAVLISGIISLFLAWGIQTHLSRDLCENINADRRAEAEILDAAAQRPGISAETQKFYLDLADGFRSRVAECRSIPFLED